MSWKSNGYSCSMHASAVCSTHSHNLAPLSLLLPLLHFFALGADTGCVALAMPLPGPPYEVVSVEIWTESEMNRHV